MWTCAEKSTGLGASEEGKGVLWGRGGKHPQKLKQLWVISNSSIKSWSLPISGPVVGYNVT